jgi:hypothetical protein
LEAGKNIMKKIIIATWAIVALALACSVANAHATNLCGQTLSGYVTLDADQNCVTEGIRLNAGATLDGAGRHIYGYQLPTDKACVRALNTATGSITVKNVTIEGCGEGINFDTVKSPRVNYATIANTRGSAGIRCKACSTGIFHHTYVTNNVQNGILYQGGSQNQAYNNSVTGNGTGVRITANASQTASGVKLYDNWNVYNIGWSVVFDGSTNNSYSNNIHSPWWTDKVLFTASTFSNFAHGQNYCQDDAKRGQCQ